MQMSNPVARKSAIAPGQMTRVMVEGVPVLLCNVEGELYAVEDVCTHDDGELDGGELEGCQIICPRHGAKFDVTTGQALTLPAVTPLPTYTVRVDGDDVSVEPVDRD
jgi:3-phenylpropionate/trans-cinnamate dioxygenase ferredoxin component